MIKAVSHLVIASNEVEKVSQFFSAVFEVTPHFINSEFSDFVLESKCRVAFFKPVGKTKKYFRSDTDRSQVSYGVTVEDVDKCYQKLMTLKKDFKFEVSGEPKDHPWGEKSFLLVDVEGNKWEITQSPNEAGLLENL